MRTRTQTEEGWWKTEIAHRCGALVILIHGHQISMKQHRKSTAGNASTLSEGKLRVSMKGTATFSSRAKARALRKYVPRDKNVTLQKEINVKARPDSAASMRMAWKKQRYTTHSDTRYSATIRKSFLSPAGAGCAMSTRIPPNFDHYECTPRPCIPCNTARIKVDKTLSVCRLYHHPFTRNPY